MSRGRIVVRSCFFLWDGIKQTFSPIDSILTGLHFPIIAGIVDIQIMKNRGTASPEIGLSGGVPRTHPPERGVLRWQENPAGLRPGKAN